MFSALSQCGGTVVVRRVLGVAMCVHPLFYEDLSRILRIRFCAVFRFDEQSVSEIFEKLFLRWRWVCSFLSSWSVYYFWKITSSISPSTQ